MKVGATDVVDGGLEEVSDESRTEAAEEVSEEKVGEKDGNSQDTEEQAPKSEESSGSETEQTEGQTDKDALGETAGNESNMADEMTERDTEEAVEEAESENKPEIVEEAEIADVYENNDGYPYNVAAGVYIVDKWGFYQCECTSFVAYCINERNGFSFWNTMYGSTDTKNGGMQITGEMWQNRYIPETNEK